MGASDDQNTTPLFAVPWCVGHSGRTFGPSNRLALSLHLGGRVDHMYTDTASHLG